MKNPKTIKGLALNVRRAMARAQKPMKKTAMDRVLANVLVKAAAVTGKAKKGVAKKVVDEAQAGAAERTSQGWPGGWSGRPIRHGAESPLMKQGSAGKLLAALGAAGALSYAGGKMKDKSKKKVETAVSRPQNRLARLGLSLK